MIKSKDNRITAAKLKVVMNGIVETIHKKFIGHSDVSTCHRCGERRTCACEYKVLDSKL